MTDGRYCIVLGKVSEKRRPRAYRCVWFIRALGRYAHGVFGSAMERSVICCA